MGTLPSDLANLSKLAQIVISDNTLTGWIPTEYGKMTQMTELSLYGNEGLSRPIPSELANLIDLSILWLYETNLSGSIPHNKHMFKGVTLHLSARIIAWSPAPAEIE
jgi:Leucine-rich repeat (LRR) protein